jgi:murein DD-endopeptidase MepM/ murein hydrolase activator NlpD
MRRRVNGTPVLRYLRAALALPLIGVLGACSADVVRLDGPANFSLTENSGPRPSVGLNRSSVGASGVDLSSGASTAPQQAYVPPRAVESDVRVAALPDATPAPLSETYVAPARPVPQPFTPPPSQARPTSSSPAPAATAAPARSFAEPAPKTLTAEKGQAIVVQQGDTLYGLSRTHKVPLSALMQVNGLTQPNLKPGQTIYLPKTAMKPLQRPAPVAPQPVSADLAAKYGGSYKVQKGDSLYALALKMKVPLAELQQVNGITDVRKVKPGAVLKVPGSAVAAAPSPTTTPVTASVPPAPAKVPTSVITKEASIAPATGAASPKPVLLNGEKQVAAVDPTTTTDGTQATSAAPELKSSTKVAAAGSSAAAGSDVKLRWPVRGKVIAGFGPRPDGTHNDGVNLQVPQGTDVHAAEAGVVAYSGSELKGYGNLILVRHDNGWITAYAHNSEILAKRGDRVKRGQVIAKAGKSGQIDQPQVHFELRQGSKPVDPTPFMEKL